MIHSQSLAAGAGLQAGLRHPLGRRGHRNCGGNCGAGGGERAGDLEAARGWRVGGRRRGGGDHTEGQAVCGAGRMFGSLLCGAPERCDFWFSIEFRLFKNAIFRLTFGTFWRTGEKKKKKKRKKGKDGKKKNNNKGNPTADFLSAGGR